MNTILLNIQSATIEIKAKPTTGTATGISHFFLFNPSSLHGCLKSGLYFTENSGSIKHSLQRGRFNPSQLDCIVAPINKTIKCNLGSGTGNKNIKIINTKHTNVLFLGNGLFNYQNQIITCPNNCSGKNDGKCNTNTGECQYYNIFTGIN
ncbi:hypothetical protein RB653_002841 [Dictyostelium firmibasis]|uniref:Uncharacterized protein n=1 Tax=Dictyostelium firmibasis TaxID=79012 RepID=A0AAN7UAF4_9MYCE